MSHPAPEDLAAAVAARRHHAQLCAEIVERTEALLRFADTQYLLKAEHARRDLVAYLRAELVPHALAEERTLYAAAAALPAGALLVEGMTGEHATIVALLDELESAASMLRAAAAARALSAVVTAHVEKENELVLPLLTGTPGVSLAALLGDVHELLGAAHDGQGEPAPAREEAAV